MKNCTCKIEQPKEWNYCPHCAGGNPKKLVSGSPMTCDKCDRPILYSDNFCWNCREPNRFKMAAILFEMKERRDKEADYAGYA